jgi:IS66 C-terminal element
VQTPLFATMPAPSAPTLVTRDDHHLRSKPDKAAIRRRLPNGWLRDVLTRIAAHPINRIDELLPGTGRPHERTTIFVARSGYAIVGTATWSSTPTRKNMEISEPYAQNRTPAVTPVFVSMH